MHNQDTTDPPSYEGLSDDERESLRESERTAIHSFRQAIYWVQAIEFQGNRVLAVHQRQYAGVFNGPARLEEQFFLTASEKAVRLIHVLSNEGKVEEEIRRFLPTKAMREFKRTMKSNKIRNKREHEEQHVKPDIRNDELVDASNPKSGLVLKVSSGVTIKRDGDVIIGGEVSVRNTVAAAKTLNPHLVESQHRYERSRKKMLEAANPDHFPDIFAPKKIF